jgi:hypothetical protein
MKRLGLSLHAWAAVAALTFGSTVGSTVGFGLGTAHAETAWQELKSPTCKSSIQFPGKPTEQKQKVPSAAGELDATMYLFESAGGTGAFVLMCNDYPKDLVDKATSDKILAGARDGAAKQMEGKVVSEKKLTLGGFPGLEVEIDTGEFRYTARLILAKTRLHQAVSMMKRDKPNPGDTRKFLDSLKLDAP